MRFNQMPIVLVTAIIIHSGPCPMFIRARVCDLNCTPVVRGRALTLGEAATASTTTAP